MAALTSTLVDICSAGAGRVWLDQCLALPQWAQMAQYRTRFAALQSTLDEVNRRLEEGQDCHLCVLTPDAIRSLQSRWPARIDSERASSKFDRKRRVLTIIAPLLAAEQPGHHAGTAD